MSFIEPYQPINTLKPVCEEVWIVDGPIIHFHYFDAQHSFLSLPFPTRMTIVRLADGGLWVHSPTQLTSDLKSEVDALGPVRHLVAPNKIHFWWAPEWKDAYPDAVAHAARWVRDRAGERKDAFDRDLAESGDQTWAGEIDQIAVPGSYMTEVVFLHRRSRTLILADLIQNYEASKVTSALARCLIRIAGGMHPEGKTPADLRFSFRPHKDRVRLAVQTMIDWRPERIIIAHGRWYEQNAVAELERAFRWLGPLRDAPLPSAEAVR